MGNTEMGGNSPDKKLLPRDLLVQSGIAERMLEDIKKYKGTQDPEITFGIEDCDFKVEQTEDPHTEELHTQVVIEMPNLHPENRKIQPRVTVAFGVEEGKSFGAAGEPPLTQDQFNIIQNMLKEQTEA